MFKIVVVHGSTLLYTFHFLKDKVS